MINFSHVYKTYPGPVHALSNIELNIEKGEFVYLIGPSGAGKTTLFRMISAFDRPSSGELKIAGHDLNKMRFGEVPFYRRRIGVIFQDFKLLKDRSIVENISLPLEICGDRKHTIQKRVQEMLNHVGLWHKREQLPEQLSGGEQQRVAIARALIHQPGVLIADEPTGNLDRDLSHEIMDLLDKVNAQGTTVFVATHDLELVAARARRVIEINKGVIVKDTRK